MKLKLLSGIILMTMLTVMASACAPSSTTAPKPTAGLGGTLQVYVTDAPPREEVTSIMVTISEVQVHIAEAEQEREESTSDNETLKQEQEEDSGGEWITIKLNDDATTFDLLEIRGIEQHLGASEVATGKYTQVRLVVDTIQVALEEGELQDAIVPSGELKIVRPFDVVAGVTTTLVLDFEADKMVSVTGANKIIVKPVVKLFVRQGGDKPQDAEPNGNIKLEDGKWILQSYGDPANPKAVLEGTLILADFDESTGQVTGNAGANSYFGSYEVEDTTLTIPGPIGATEMYRMDPEGVMDQEQEYLSLLQQSEAYSITGDILSITCGNQILIFRYTTGLKPAS